MLGYPKYKTGDTVKFSIDEDTDNIKVYKGEVYIVDRYGTFEDNSDVSYDIMVQDDKYIDSVNTKGLCLYKHINEKYIID